MKEIIGTVAKIEEGIFSVKGLNGNIKTLNVGDEILKNEIVHGEAINTDESVIEIKLVNNEGNILLTGEEEIKFDSSLTKTINEEVAFNKEDLTALETASGEEELQDENSFKANFNARDGDLTNVESNLRDTTTGVDKKKEVTNITLFEKIEVEKLTEPTPTEPTPTTVSIKQSSTVSYKYQIHEADTTTYKTGKTGTVEAYDNKQYKISDKYPDIKISLLDGVIKANDKGELYFTYAVEIDKPLDVALQVNAELTGSTVLPNHSENNYNIVDGIKKNLIIAPGETKITFDFYFKELIEHEDSLIQQAKNLLSEGEITKEQYDSFYEKIMINRLEHSDKEDVYSNDKFFIQNNFIYIRYDPKSVKELLDNTPDEKTKADLKAFYGVDAYLENWDGETASNMTIRTAGDSKIDTTTIDFEVNFKPPYELEIKAISSNPSYFSNNNNDISDWNSNYKDLDVHFVFKDIITGKKYNATVKLDDEFLKEGKSKLDLSKMGVYVNGKYEVGHFSSGNWALEDVSYGWWKQFEDVSFGSFKIISTQEFKYEIETSNKPDLSKYDFITTFPTVKVETTFINSLNVESKEIYEVKLDKDGKGILTIEKDSIQKISDVKVLEVDGNFEKTEIETIKDDVIYKDITMPTKDIDLSNLPSIISKNEINLKNGTADKLLNISLEDVLKLSPEKLITIKGDEFDKVTFKNTLTNDGTQNNWSKTAGVGEDSGYDIYINSGDLGVQVKVEQPISDGITS
ncbi:hypothetical protein [Arcobacter sp. CECT 9188]|uniref:hypothetical protein n=1 Tax=Arcobacter sp. CECT 9188 TaxID=2044505 RepID=UPI000DEA2451|nr:hypothetical protein [Arcobacter sp. CECT 9188]RBQ27640.1 hypothetical protein CRU88_02940 [Arcobacter sp. CECT 9188]